MDGGNKEKRATKVTNGNEGVSGGNKDPGRCSRRGVYPLVETMVWNT